MFHFYIFGKKYPKKLFRQYSSFKNQLNKIKQFHSIRTEISVQKKNSHVDNLQINPDVINYFFFLINHIYINR